MQKVGASSSGKIMRGSEIFTFNNMLESQSMRAEKVITAVESVSSGQVRAGAAPPNLGQNVDVRV